MRPAHSQSRLSNAFQCFQLVGSAEANFASLLSCKRVRMVAASRRKVEFLGPRHGFSMFPIPAGWLDSSQNLEFAAQAYWIPDPKPFPDYETYVQMWLVCERVDF